MHRHDLCVCGRVYEVLLSVERCLSRILRKNRQGWRDLV